MSLYLSPDYLKTSYLVPLAVILTLLTLYKLRNMITGPQQSILHSVAVIVYILKICSIVIFCYFPDNMYHAWSMALSSSFQSIVIAIFLALIQEGKFKEGQNEGAIKKDINIITESIIKDKSGIFYLIFWNILLYILMDLAKSFEGAFIGSGILAFMVCSYWLTAYKFSSLSSKLAKAEGTQIKLDLIIMCLIMMGLLTLASPFLNLLYSKSIVTILGSLYIFEIAVVLAISEGDIPNEIQRCLVNQSADAENLV